MESRTADTRGPLATFLCLTFGASAVFWWLIVRAGSLGVHGGAYVWLTGEFGAGLAVAFVALGWIFWRQRAAVSSPNVGQIGSAGTGPAAGVVPATR